MSHTIVWHDSAVDGLRRLRSTTPDAVKALTTIVGELADNPRPDAAPELGSSGLYRLRVGELRVVYEVDDHKRTVYVLTVGRVQS